MSREGDIPPPKSNNSLIAKPWKAMPFFTPNGLKIRLDPDRTAPIVRPLTTQIELTEILLDVELWENLPIGFITISTSLAVLISNSVWVMIVAAAVAFSVGSFLRSFTYSDSLRKLIPLFLGSWPVTLLQTTGVSIYLIMRGEYWITVILCLLNVGAHLGVFEVLDLLLAPIRIPLRKVLGLQPTHQEGVFVAICNRRAEKFGLVLDWNQYE